jgi:hypothetical protein
MRISADNIESFIQVCAGLTKYGIAYEADAHTLDIVVTGTY